MTATEQSDATTESLSARLWSLARRAPATIIVTLVVLGVGIATGAMWTPAEETGLVERWGFGLPAFEEGNWLSLIVGAGISPTPWMYALILATFIVGAGYLEIHYGTIRMLLAVIGTHIAAVLVVAAMFWVLRDVDLVWIQELAQVKDVGLSNAGFGALGAVTAAMPLLWRRRARLIGVLYSVAMILYAGEIWDFTHAAAFAIGLAIGPWVVGRSWERPQWTMGRQEVRDIAAVIVAFNALHNLLTRIWPGEGGVLSFGRPESSDASLLVHVGLAIISLVIAYGLHGGRRAAWWVTLVLTVLGAALLLAVPKDANLWFDLVLDFVLLAVLALGASHFAVKGDRPSRRRIYVRVLLTALGVAAFTAVGILALRGSFEPEPTAGQALVESTFRIFGLTTGEFEPTTRAATVFLESISIIWFILAAGAFAVVLLSIRRPAEDASARDHFIGLQTHTTGMTDIGYMARWPGMSYWVSDDRTAAFAYRHEGSTAIVLSDPAGNPDALRRAFPAFDDFCRSRGMRPAYFAVSTRVRDELAEVDYRSIQVAEDTVIRLADLAFTGKAWQDVRSAINRAGREGVSMQTMRLAEAPRGVRDQLETIAAQWAGDKSLPELGFTLGTLREAEDPNVVMHLAVHEDGTVHGMTSWMPVYREGYVVGWTIDIMQRRLDDATMSGVMEFLIAQTAMEFKAQGYEHISLSSAPLSFSDTESQGSVERLLDVLADRMEPYYGFSSLERFKAKFKPEHVPLHLCFQDEAQLPAITLAILRAYVPDAGPSDLLKAARPGK